MRNYFGAPPAGRNYAVYRDEQLATVGWRPTMMAPALFTHPHESTRDVMATIGRVSGAVNLVNETITSKMETVRYGEEFEARLQALEVQIEVQREGHVESAIRVEDTIVAMSNRLQILEEAIIKEQESTLQQLEQLIKISPSTHHPQRGGKVRNAKRSRE